MNSGGHEMSYDLSTILGYGLVYVVVSFYVFIKSMPVFKFRVQNAWINGFSVDNSYATAILNQKHVVRGIISSPISTQKDGLSNTIATQREESTNILACLVAAWIAFWYNGALIVSLSFGWPIIFAPIWLMAWLFPKLILYSLSTAFVVLAMQRAIPWMAGWDANNRVMLT